MSLTQSRAAVAVAVQDAPVIRLISSDSVHPWTAEFFDFTVHAVPTSGRDPIVVPCKVRFTVLDLMGGYGSRSLYSAANRLVRRAMPGFFVPHHPGWIVADNSEEAPF